MRSTVSRLSGRTVIVRQSLSYSVLSAEKSAMDYPVLSEEESEEPAATTRACAAPDIPLRAGGSIEPKTGDPGQALASRLRLVCRRTALRSETRAGYASLMLERIRTSVV